MKNILLAFSLFGLLGAAVASNYCGGDDKDKKKSCCSKKERKSCCSKKEGKSCSKEKDAEKTETTESKPAEEKK